MASNSSVTAWLMVPTADANLEPANLAAWAKAFSGQVETSEQVSLVLTRTDEGVRGYLVAPRSPANGDVLAKQLAQAVGARADVCPAVPEFFESSQSVGTLVFDSGEGVARDSQMGQTLASVSQVLAMALPVGGWVGVSLRRTAKSEGKRHQLWLTHRMSNQNPTHHSFSPAPLVMSVFAGADDAELTTRLLEAVRSALPGFDVPSKPRMVSKVRSGLPWLGAAALAVTLRVVLGVTSVVPASVSDRVSGWLVGAAVVWLLWGAGVATGVLPSRARTVTRWLNSGMLPPPWRRRRKPKKPRKEKTVGDKTREAHPGDYPLDTSAFLVGPTVVVGVVAPLAGAESGQVSTKQRAVAPVLLSPIGPPVGSVEGKPVFVSAPDMEGGIAITGRAGSGKTQLVRSLFGWACFDRTQPTNIPGAPGARHTIVAIETKGDGLTEWESWVQAAGDGCVTVDLADPTSPAIDIMAIPGSAQERAGFFANALKHVFGDSAVGDRSFETILQLTPAALLISPQMASRVQSVPPNGSWMLFLHTLLGGRGDEAAVGLASEVMNAGVQPDATQEVRDAAAELLNMFGPKVTATQRRNLQEAPRNKIRQLLELEQWWSPARPKTTWDQVLNSHWVVVINVGTSRQQRLVEDELTAQMAGLLMYSLMHAVRRNCSGWQAQGRTVSVFSDELRVVAAASPTVVSWMKDEGRAWGVRLCLATQRLSQLNAGVLDAFKNMSTLVTFAQEEADSARVLADAIDGGAGEWSVQDVMQLPKYHAIVRPTVDKSMMPGFMALVTNFEADRASMARARGAASAPVPMAPTTLTPPSPVATVTMPDPAPTHLPPVAVATPPASPAPAVSAPNPWMGVPGFESAPAPTPTQQEGLDVDGYGSLM